MPPLAARPVQGLNCLVSGCVSLKSAPSKATSVRLVCLQKHLTTRLPCQSSRCRQGVAGGRALHAARPLHVVAVASDSESKRAPKKRKARKRNGPKIELVTARSVAVLQLMRLEEDKAYIRLVGDHKVEGLSSPHKRLVKRLVSGVTRQRRWLDFLIRTYYTRSINRLDCSVKQILRLALYEFTQHDKPVHVVSEYVELAKGLARASAGARRAAGGLVNAILRSALRDLEAGTLPDPLAEPLPTPLPFPVAGEASEERRAEAAALVDRIGDKFSHPSWLVEHWLGSRGWEETRQLLEANNQQPAQGVRVSLHHPSRPSVSALVEELQGAGVECAPSPLLPEEFLRVSGGLQAVVERGLLLEGLAAAQDEAAGLVVQLLDPQEGEHVADVCAAPGGKALFAAQRLGPRGRVTAVDVSARRLRALRSAAELQGVGERVEAVAADCREWAEAEAAGGRGGFDRVLVDAPCSGLGVLAKRADLRWQRDPQDLRDLTALQASLLAAAAAVVRPGGVLVYSTCSIEAAENEDIVHAFLAQHPEFRVEAPPAGLMPPAVLTAEGFLATLPHRHGTDGAFGARLVRAV